MPKVRCSVCHEYIDKDKMYRTSPLFKVCSKDCLYDSRTRKPRVANEKRTDGGTIPDAVRKAVYRRDAHRCRYCGTQNSLHVHHVVYRSQGGKHVEENLITLCTDHHALVHSSKERWMPVLLGVLWMGYVEGKKLSIPQLERQLNAHG